jgi:hypothetical protein
MPSGDAVEVTLQLAVLGDAQGCKLIPHVRQLWCQLPVALGSML